MVNNSTEVIYCKNKNDKNVPKIQVWYKKKNIPKALRQQVWIKHFGEIFKSKCHIKWCKNIITVFNYECGHNIPESKGGETTIDNLFPICSSCNKSMSDNYTISEWQSFQSNSGFMLRIIKYIFG